MVPTVDVAPIYLGVQQGYFSAEHLDLTLAPAQGGAAIVPAVVGGQYEFGFSNTTSLLLGSSEGLPLKVVAAGDSAGSDPAADFCRVVVAAGSPVRQFADLAGRKVAVNTLKNINTTTIDQLVRSDGGDPSRIHFVEMPFADIPTAVAKGEVDAGQVVEPYATSAVRLGERSLGSNCAGTAPGLPVAEYFTSTAYVAQHPRVVEEFTAAMNRSLTYARTHPEAARGIVSSYLPIDPAVQSRMVLPVWRTSISAPGVEKLVQAGTADGLFPKAPNVDALMP
ncbi:MAG: ABC transporter substrate-binding protein [Nocardioides sp.]|nr:ABC transporter substrate-binding protein [Nocardioides sp.]